MAVKGQQANLTDASRVFVLTVRNQEANQAPPGQEKSLAASGRVPTKRTLKTPPTEVGGPKRPKFVSRSVLGICAAR